LEHPAEIKVYLKDQERIFEEIKAQHPMPLGMVERFERAKNEGLDFHCEGWANPNTIHLTPSSLARTV